MRHDRPSPVDPAERLLAMSRKLAEAVSVQDALDAVADDMAALIPFTHADICLLDRPGWTVTHEIGIRTHWSRRRTRIDAAPIRDVLTGALPWMLTDDAMSDARYTYPGARSEPIFRHGLRARVNVPMRVMGQIFGTLNISHGQAGFYDECALAMARALAGVLAPWFKALHVEETAQQAARIRDAAESREEGLRRDALDLTQALEQERQRIGMDLHDQTLADLSRLLRDLASDGPGPDRDALAARIGDAIDDLRQIIDTAVPTLLELFGFGHAVRTHLDRAIGEAAITGLVEDRSDGAADRLDPTTRTALYRIAQEAVNNAVRHGGAGWIGVTITPEEGGLTVEIRDDGRGLGPAGAGPCSGLAHMRTRARLIAADLQIFSDGGTCVRVRTARGSEPAS